MCAPRTADTQAGYLGVRDDPQKILTEGMSQTHEEMESMILAFSLFCYNLDPHYFFRNACPWPGYTAKHRRSFFVMRQDTYKTKPIY